MAAEASLIGLAVIVGGVVSLGLLGNYTYFGTVDAALPPAAGWH